MFKSERILSRFLLMHAHLYLGQESPETLCSGFSFNLGAISTLMENAVYLSTELKASCFLPHKGSSVL